MSRAKKAAIVLAAYALLGVAVYAVRANAADVVVPEKYRIMGPAPADGRERPAALNGNTYTVITPIFDGDEGNTSYIRLANLNTFSVTVTITVVGSPTGRVYGSAALVIPPKASKQYAYSSVLAAAGIAGYVGEDNVFSFYMRSSEDLTGFQHVVHNAGNGFFENMSACTWDPTFNYTNLNRALGNVHTTNHYMTEYPSIVMLHHYGATRALYRVDLYAAETGAYKGGFSFFAEANESFIIPMSWYLETAGWAPSDMESHANLVFSRDDGGLFEGIAAHAVRNDRIGSYVNMTQFCGINR